jgi:hypothetical protein
MVTLEPPAVLSEQRKQRDDATQPEKSKVPAAFLARKRNILSFPAGI